VYILNLAKLYIKEKTEKYLYRFIRSNYGEVSYLSTVYSFGDVYVSKKPQFKKSEMHRGLPSGAVVSASKASRRGAI
jgi:hypothetical protein